MKTIHAQKRKEINLIIL